MPRPRFSNIFTAYSSMSAYGLNVSTVATTTTSPRRLLQRPNQRVHPRALAPSMTLREVVDRLRQLRRSGCACARSPRAAQTHTTRSSIAARHASGAADPDGVTFLYAPSVDSTCQLFDGRQIFGKETRRSAAGTRGSTFQRQHVCDQLRRGCPTARAPARVDFASCQCV